MTFALEKLQSLLEVRFATSKEELEFHLFSNLKVLDGSRNTALGLAVKNGHADIVGILLKAEKRLAGPEYLTDGHIKGALGNGKKAIMNMVLDAQPDIAEKLPELIVRAGGPRCKEMWTEMAPRFEKFLQESEILHVAVQERQLDIIDWLVYKFPQMATRKDEEGRIALSYNNDQAQYSRDGLVKENIRRLIVPEIVRLCTPTEMKQLLRVANGGHYDRSVRRSD